MKSIKVEICMNEQVLSVGQLSEFDGLSNVVTGQIKEMIVKGEIQ